MGDDFERLIEDNLCLKKSLQVSRHQNDKLQQELSDLRVQQQELQERNGHLHHLHAQLQKKYQLLMGEHGKDVNTLTSQLEELKTLIEQKQAELENFQIKILPNLDQDMLRVKLITEMEGPYQEVVDKKEREIARLKEKLMEADRRGNLVELQLETKQKELRRELSDARKFYEQQNEKVMKELNLALNRKETRSYDKETFKVQRKELQELRCTLDLQSQNEAELRKQVMGLKVDKEKLLIQMAQLNEKKALEMHLSSENTEIRVMKQERKKMEEELQRKNEELEKMERRVKAVEKEASQMEEEMKRANNRSKEQWDADREGFKEEARKDKDELRKVINAKERLEDELQIISQKLKASDRELNNKKDECEKLKANMTEMERSLKEYEFAKKQKLTLSKNLREESLERPRRKEYTEQSDKKENNETQPNLIINKKPEKEKEKDKSQLKELEKANAKLKEKLEEANRKIVELLKQKAKGGNNLKTITTPNHPHTITRDRAFSNVELDSRLPTSNDKPLLLEFRDTSFVPLVPPTIYTQHPVKRY